MLQRYDAIRADLKSSCHEIATPLQLFSGNANPAKGTTSWTSSLRKGGVLHFWKRPGVIAT
jgi:hypothetical protein